MVANQSKCEYGVEVNQSKCEYGVEVNQSKCEFRTSSVEYLGHRIDER